MILLYHLATLFATLFATLYATLNVTILILYELTFILQKEPFFCQVYYTNIII